MQDCVRTNSKGRTVLSGTIDQITNLAVAWGTLGFARQAADLHQLADEIKRGQSMMDQAFVNLLKEYGPKGYEDYGKESDGAI